ncbi:MAG: NHL repeat-containing protein [Thermoleophilaceae bacterium]
MIATRPHIRLRTALIGTALALALLAWPAGASAAFLSPEGSFRASEGAFGDLRGIATDDAGRVYVADASRGRVEVYDNARNGNAFLRSIGEGQLVSPTGVAVDNRSRIYVSDAGRGAVVQFDSLADDAPRRRSFAFPSGSGAPRGLDVDLSSQVYVADRGTGRVQVLQIKGRDLVGLSEVASSLGEIEGVARDSKGRIYVSSDNEENGEVRAIDEKGQALRVVAPAGDRKEIAGGPGRWQGRGEVRAGRGRNRERPQAARRRPP